MICDSGELLKNPLMFTFDLNATDRAQAVKRGQGGAETLPAEEIVSPRQVDVRLDGAGSLAAPSGPLYKNAEDLRAFPHLFQNDVTDGGAACLAMVCRHFNLPVSLSRIRQVVHAGPAGPSLRSLCQGAIEIGLAARSVQALPRHLSDMPLPAIVHTHGDQWITLYQLESGWADVADPAQGLRRISRAEFERLWSGYAILFDYVGAVDNVAANAEEEQPRRRKTGIRWLWPFLRPFTGVMLKTIALAFIGSAMEMLRPVFTQIIIDRVLVGKDGELLKVIIFALAGVLCFNIASLVVQRYLLSFVAVRFDGAILDYITRKLLALPMTYFNTRRAGDIQNRLLGMAQVRDFLTQYGVTGITAASQLSAALALMFAYSAPLALVFISLAPLYAALIVVSRRRLRPIFNELKEAQSKYQSQQIEAIKGMETVKSLSAEGRLRELMLHQFHRVSRQQFKGNLTSFYYDGAVSAAAFISIILFLCAGAYQVLEGKLTIGGLAAFNFLVALANGPIKDLLKMWDAYQSVSVQLNRLDDIVSQEAARSPWVAQNGDSEFVALAPCSGTILRLHVKANGAIVSDGEPLCEIACAGERLQAELQIPQAGIGRIRNGQGVRLMYDSFPYQQFGVKFGALCWISPTASTQTFRAIAEIEAENVMVLGQPTPLKAGMGGRAEVVIARRSLISFALDPIRQLRENMAAPPDRRAKEQPTAQDGASNISGNTNRVSHLKD